MTAPAFEDALPDITLRPWNREDRREHSFVWETSLKVRRPRGMSWSAWQAAYGEQVTQALAHSTVLVADAGGDLLAGFVVRDDVAGAVWMLYVKTVYRGDGLGIRLLRGAGIDTTSPVHAIAPTASWWRWTELRGIETERPR